MKLTKKLVIFFGIILVGVVVGGWVAFYAKHVQPEPILSSRISESTLESQYGMRVSLIAVTGAGGFVDVRIKIVNGEKAKMLLADKNNFPSLLADNDVVLEAPEDTRAQEIQYDDGGTMFILYPNSGNAVTHGSPVNILFGDVAVDPIPAK